MTHPTHATPARVIAIAMIAALAALLAIRSLGHASTVSVPHGAHAGQLLRLHSCTYATEKGKYAADCGTLVVPENRRHPGSRLIALPVTRVRATSTHQGPPVFYLQGGPGLTNMDFPQASRYAGDGHDVVLVGYRGVDGSVRLSCPEVSSALTGTSDLLAKHTLRAYSAAFGHCAKRLTNHGVDVTGYNSVERVDDMEAARTAFGYPSVNLISESAGTRTAMIYAWRHPHSVNRSVMLGVNPPGHYLYDGATTDAQIAHYSDLCAHDSGCRSETRDLTATMRAEARHLPHRWLFLPIKPGNVKLATFYGLASATSNASPLSAPQTIDTWTRASHGDASGLWLLSLLADLSIPTSHVWGDVAATGQLDDATATAYYASGGDHGSILANSFTEHLWGGGGLATAWPHASEVDQYRNLQPTDVDTLLISGDVDFATPAQFATHELLPTLHHGHQVILHNLGHTDDTWNYQKPAATRLVNTFLDSGRVDASAYTPRTMSFNASPTHAMVAKIVLTSLLGLAVIAVGLLVWLPLRLRRRDNVGRKTGVVTRSVYAALIGLGCWCLGIVAILAAWPSLSISAAPVNVLVIAAPVSAAVYLGWVHRAWPQAVRVAGLAATVGGAVLGAWLGLQAVSGAFGAMVAVLSAVLGANLAVLVRDVVSGTPAASGPAPTETPHPPLTVTL